MKIMFNSSLLNDFIKKSKFVKSEGIQIRSADGKIQLVNCDLESQVTTNIMGDVCEAGNIIIPKDIFPLIKDNEPMIVITNKITVGSRSIEFASNNDYYPTIEDDFKYNVFDLSNKEIKTLLEVEHAISKDHTKPLLTGIRIQNNKFITIDGYRMCERTGDFKSDVPVSISNHKMLKALRGQIKATCSNRYINYQVGNYNYSNRLLEGEFIEIDKLKPRDHNTLIQVNKDELEEILKSMEKASTSVRNKLVQLGIRDNVLHIKTSNEKVVLADSMQCKTTGDNLDIAFNSTYLLEAVKDMHTTINMKFTTNVNPVVIESPGKYELILPVREASDIERR